MAIAPLSVSDTFQQFQAKQWLGRFWTKGLFQIVLVGARKCVGSPLLENILGERGDSRVRFLEQPGQRDSMRSTDSDHFFEDDADVGGFRVRSYLVPAPSDAIGYKSEKYIREVRSFMANAQLVIYCIDMSDTRLRGSVLRMFQELSRDLDWSWSRAVIVLTFADALPGLLRHRDNPNFPKAKYFNYKLTEWTAELKAMLEQVGVHQEEVAKIDVCPCVDEPGDLLPNGKPWLPPLSLAIMEILSPVEKATFLEKHAKLLPTVSAAVNVLATQSPIIASGADLDLELMATVPVGTRTEIQSSTDSRSQASAASPVLSEDQSHSIRAALSKLRKDCRVFGILVIGRTGVGKSTLINNLLGKKVASVGHTLKSETPKVYPHEDKVEGVPIVVYDTPGLGDIKGKEDEKKHLDIMKAILKREKIHLVVYCFQMSESTMTSNIVGTLREYHKIGVDWERSVIALTFADALYVPKSEQEHPSFQMTEYFNKRLVFWKNELVNELVKTVRVNPDVVARLKIYPTSLLPKDQLPNGESWYIPLWLHIVDMLSPAAASQFLGMHWINIRDQQAPPLSEHAEVEVPLDGEGKKWLAGTVAELAVCKREATRQDHTEILRALSESGHGVRPIVILLNPEQTAQRQWPSLCNCFCCPNEQPEHRRSITILANEPHGANISFDA